MNARTYLMAALILLCLPLETKAVVEEGEYYIYNDFFERLLTNDSSNDPKLADYSSSNDAKFLFVAEASGTDGYVKLKHKSTGLYLTASTSNSYSVLLSNSGSGDQYLWQLDQLFSTTIVSKKSTSKRLGCDFSSGDTYYWSNNTYVPVYYDKSAGALNWFSVIPSNGEGFEASREAAKTAEFTNEYGVLEQDAYCVSEPVTVNGLDYHIISSTPFSGNGSVNLEGRGSWLVFESVQPSTVISSYLSYVTIDGAKAQSGTNCRVEIFLRGAAVIPLSDEDPFVATTDEGTFSCPLGNTSNLGENSNKARSFTLKRGYMATVATDESGGDYSRVYVADHADLTVTLPTPLDQRISSVYVRNWHYTSKAGYPGSDTGAVKACGATWYWNWDANSSSSNDLEYIPIKQHLYWPDDGNFYNSTYTAMMMFNEPEHSEQHEDCSCGGTIDAWKAYQNTPKFNATGLRIGSPSATDLSYIKEYLGHCDDMKQRCDFSCTHGYWTTEWSTDFYTLIGYGRPIWITEWEYGASWTTSYTPSSTNEYAGQVLNVLDLMEYNNHVERYALYPDDTGGTNGWERELFWDSNYLHGTAPAGTVYKKVKPHFGYDSSVQATPNWWAPSVQTPSIDFATLQDGQYALSVTNANGDATASLVVMMLEDDGSWTEVGSITDRSEFDPTTEVITLSDEVEEGSTLKLVLKGLFSDTEVESDKYTFPRFHTLSDLENLTFDEGTFVNKSVLTYAYDITNEASQTSGMQAVDGWDIVSNGDARAAGQYAFGSSYFLGSSDYKIPVYNSEGTNAGGALGIVSVWTAETQYTQNVILEAGDYDLEIPVYNTSGTGAISKNLIGFVADSGEEYLLSATTYPVGEWTTETLSFGLEEQTAGKLSLGYTAADKGSSDMPHLFIDYVGITYNPYVYTPTINYATLQDGVFTLSVSNPNAEETASLIVLMQEEDGTWTEVASVTDSLQLCLEELSIPLSEDVVDGSLVKVVVTTSYSTKAKESEEFVVSQTKDLSEIQNLTFDEGTFVTKSVRTYDYDVTDETTETSGMQPVDGWDMAVSNGNARSSGQYAFGSSLFLGSPDYLAPATNSDGTTEGGAFGVVSVWTAQTQYTQSVLLPAGDYELVIPVYNVSGTTAFEKNLIGFIEQDGTEHLLSATTYTVGEWTLETLSFSLDEDTPGKLSLGYTAANKGSGSMPHLFVDYIKIVKDGETDSEEQEEEGEDEGDGEDVDTSLTGITPSQAQPDTYYDLTGRRLSSPKQGGIYIKGGTKVLVR
ncbi:MAG: glycoside hydrolase family protein [Prevotellaceae bacterium]|nr:glycoside hydrolase family protein [Prevotellaceae bacterium]